MATFDYVVTIQAADKGTVTLTTNPFQVQQYHVRTADESEPEISEQMSLRVTDNAATANLDELSTLNALLLQAQRAQKNRALSKVYVTWKNAAGGTLYRSEVTQAKGEWQDTALQWPYWMGDTQFASVDLVRKNWWEGPEAQLAITNPNGTANTSGLNVFNCNDADGSSPNKRHNYFDVAGTAVAGNLMAPTRLEMTNLYSGGTALAWVWIGQNWGDTSFVHTYEALGGTNTASSSSSGGFYRVYSIPDSLETDLSTWSLTSAEMAKAGGRFYKFITRHWGEPHISTLRLRLKLKYSTDTVWDSGLTALDSSYSTTIRDMWTFKLPPWLMGLSSLGGFDMVLSGYQETGTHQSWNLDFIQLTPVDGWRHLQYIGFGTPQNNRLVDDGIDGYLYDDNGSGGDKRGVYVGYGNPIMLYPGKNQRLYFLQHSLTGNQAEIDRVVSVKLYYRPRYLSIV
jgi:hypothetical protein